MMITSIWLQKGHNMSPLETGGMTLGYLVTVLAMIRVGEKLLQRYGARLPMMTGPLLTAVAIVLISCTFLDSRSISSPFFSATCCLASGWGAMRHPLPTRR